MHRGSGELGLDGADERRVLRDHAGAEPGDHGALAHALRRVLREPALRAHLADAALEECRRVYSWTRVWQQIMDVYAAVSGTEPRLDWSPHLPVEPCRFRAEPHLL